MKAPVFPSTHVAVDVEPLKLNVIFGGSNNTLKLPVLQLPVFPAASLTNPYQVTPLDAPCSYVKTVVIAEFEYCSPPVVSA